MMHSAAPREIIKICLIIHYALLNFNQVSKIPWQWIVDIIANYSNDLILRFIIKASDTIQNLFSWHDYIVVNFFN